jgi:hypothetical protein
MFKIFSKRKPSAHNAEAILQVLNQSAKAFKFPMLDNGYVYLAASRLSAFRSDEHWAIVFEIFGFSPRARIPDLSIVTIASHLSNRNRPEDYVSDEAYKSYLRNNPNWEVRNFWPISNEDWIDPDKSEHVGMLGKINLRDELLERPNKVAYDAAGIDLGEDSPAIFELCRYLSHTRRSAVLATEAERRVSIALEMEQIMMLDDWNHPDIVNGQLPNQTKTFQNLATVLEKNDPSLYEASEPANNHWKNWPEGGSL